ncbi:MAG: hypothetical protein A2600_06125 [Candidatus Lambdaproteobacteria bacterium RIFOXYD1_FULL_56_27]|uniref:Uncharacterized protein n=1 Tax=Candidatus Lambdaproteobacteria bacterium RIFOXYD2_FULL_56_26 TaxID=1817773 RepID=A0A1F6GLF8_9PROT|nr:MAG: hypothetical protein A2557_13075 [Candidatus Lambdaproteobacteria bacterium RIFOXYD2_FULL_56_26]OGH05464.1 MAG: hypothetical protein A2426_03695 [Candidatus Lambdaproteobacteria bacterium RIFOXYC1_FULL_56_13]OGH09755.1 MAG: hypothetical protein A2600_06125 [Candidatus Lambdaproteobacteria bacterium RIFOXYD1_FULL_56_27]
MASDWIKRGLVLASLMAAGGSLSAQVVVPALDPTQPTLSAGAAGWREGDVVGSSYSDHSGSRKVGDLEVIKYTGGRLTGLVGVQFSTLAVELSSTGDRPNTKPGTGFDHPVTLKRDRQRASFSVLGSDFANLGLRTETDSKVQWMSATAVQVKTKLDKTAGDLSVKIGDSFYAGGGYAKVKEKSDLTVDNNWTETMAGVGLRFGAPGGSRFRVEVGWINAGKAVQSAYLTKAQAVHPATDTQLASLELEISGLLFSASSAVEEENVTLIDPVSGQSSGVTRNSSRGGVLWVPKEGMVLGFAFGNEKVSQLYTETFSDFEVKLGYLF